MKKKILAIGASSSRQSINKQLAAFVANQVPNSEANVLDLNDYEMVMYSIDRETENGIPEKAIEFKAHIIASDGIVISFAEHNGSYTSAFKNILDWISRIDRSVFESKPTILLSTSPGGRGGITVLDLAVSTFGYLGAEIVGHMALPNFNDNFSPTKGVTNEEFLTKINDLAAKL